MAKIPDFTALGERPAAQPSTAVGRADLATGMEGAGAKMLGEVGQGLAQDARLAAVVYAKEKSDLDTARAEDAFNALRAKQIDLTYGENGYTRLQGADAVSKPFASDYLKGITSAADQLTQGLANDEQKALFRRRADTVIAEVNRGTLIHGMQQAEVYRKQVSDGVMATELDAIGRAPTDEVAFRGSLARMDAAISNAYAGAANLQAIRTETLNKALVARFDSWRTTDPVGALAFLQTNTDKISPALKLQIGHQLYEAAAPILAAQLNAQGGPAAAVAPSVPVAPKPGEALPRGIRNNNPGNIVRSETKWQGEIGGNDPRYAAFDTPESGIRAMAKNLASYQRQGINTVADIVSRWAPASENLTQPYIESVSKALGVEPNAQLNLQDPATLGKLIPAIISHENGQQPYSTDTIKAGIDAALKQPIQVADASGAVPVGQVEPAQRVNFASITPAQALELKTGNPVIDAMPPDWKMHVIQMARSDALKDQQAARDGMNARMQDTQASYLVNGTAPNAPSERELIAAYGQTDGVEKWRRLQEVQQTGLRLQQVKTLPIADLEAMRAAAKPAEGEGFAQRQQQYEILTRAIDQVEEQRQKDPIAYAMATNSYGVKPIENLSDPATVGQAVAQRARVAANISRDYGTAPTVLTGQEAKAIATVIRSAPVEAQKQYLGTLFAGVGDMGLYKATMQQLVPDAPAVAVAGIYQARGLRTLSTPTRQPTDVSDLILRGQAILHPPGKEDGANHQGGASLIKMPDEKLMLADWNSATGDAFKGKERSSDIFQQTARSIYAALSAENGDYSGNYNAKRWKGAVALATGGIESHNGSDVVLPYGMAYDAFRDGLKARTSGMQPVGATPAELLTLPVESVGDGRYIFRRGAGYVVDKDGRPVTVDFNVDGPAPVTQPAASAQRSGPAPHALAVTHGGAVTGGVRRR